MKLQALKLQEKQNFSKLDKILLLESYEKLLLAFSVTNCEGNDLASKKIGKLLAEKRDLLIESL